MEPSEYGNRYYGVDLASGETTMLWADEILITDVGDLIFLRMFPDGTKKNVNMAYSGGDWLRVWSASIIDGSPVCVEHADTREVK